METTDQKVRRLKQKQEEAMQALFEVRDEVAELRDGWRGQPNEVRAAIWWHSLIDGMHIIDPGFDYRPENVRSREDREKSEVKPTHA